MVGSAMSGPLEEFVGRRAAAGSEPGMRALLALARRPRGIALLRP